MGAFAIEDIELKNTETNTLDLSIQISANGLSYSYYQRNTNKYLGIYHIPEINDTAKLITFFEEKSDLRNNEFAKVRIVYCTPECTIIPAVLFNENDTDKIFNLSFGDATKRKPLAIYLPASRNYMVYGIPEKLNNYLNFAFPAKLTYAQSAPFVDYGFTRHLLNNDRPLHTIFTDVYGDYFSVMLLENDKLLLFNTFRYKSANDIVYYLLSIFNQYKLDQAKTHCSVSGFIEKDSIAIIQLRKFVQFVFFEGRNTHFNFCYRFQEVPAHMFYNFLNIVECE